MKLSFYDVAPSKNNYLTIMYFKELRKFCVDRDLPIEDILDLTTVKNSTVLINASWLERGVITRLKENNNIIIAFDINDQTYFTEWIPEDEILYIDLIFEIAGLQKTKESYEIVIDDDLNYDRKKQRYRGGKWGKYFEMINADKMRSLPHPPWNSIIADNVSWEDRNKLVLLRGGHHYFRVHLYLQLLKNGLIDHNSMFSGPMYVHQYCDGHGLDPGGRCAAAADFLWRHRDADHPDRLWPPAIGLGPQRHRTGEKAGLAAEPH